MQMAQIFNRNGLITEIISNLDIPESYYEKAKERALSLEEWLLRPASTVRELSPDVYPQGSFRYGTVIRPLHKDGYYDLDLVVTFNISKSDTTQKQVKELLGGEIDAYAVAKQFNDEPDEKYRCWRLNYADEVSFHMDILPGIPADEQKLVERIELSVKPDLAIHEIAITDTRHPDYSAVCYEWFSSNPRGFARWFEENAKHYAQNQIARLLESKAYASVEEIPPYALKTDLQRIIQIIKRHRDIHFKDDCTFAPISMIITTLATRAYDGSNSLLMDLLNVVEEMPRFIKVHEPRIENPVNPKEDFADKWSSDPNYEISFYEWHSQLVSDIRTISTSSDPDLIQESVDKGLQVNVDVKSFDQSPHVTKPRTVTTATPLVITSGPKPWGK